MGICPAALTILSCSVLPWSDLSSTDVSENPEAKHTTPPASTTDSSSIIETVFSLLTPTKTASGDEGRSKVVL